MALRDGDRRRSAREPHTVGDHLDVAQSAPLNKLSSGMAAPPMMMPPPSGFPFPPPPGFPQWPPGFMPPPFPWSHPGGAVAMPFMPPPPGMPLPLYPSQRQDDDGSSSYTSESSYTGSTYSDESEEEGALRSTTASYESIHQQQAQSTVVREAVSELPGGADATRSSVYRTPRDARREAVVEERRRHAASQMEINCIRHLVDGARDHFGVGHKLMGTLEVPDPRTSERRATKAASRGQASFVQSERLALTVEERKRRREELLNQHRNNVDIQREKQRQQGQRSSSNRVRTPPPSQGARGVTLTRLKGQTPNLQDAMREGLRPKYAEAQNRRRQSDASSYTARSHQQSGAVSTASLDVGAAGRHRTSGHPAPSATADQKIFLEGIEDLYHRMRQRYTELQQNPESFAAQRNHPHPSGRRADEINLSPPKRKTYMPAKMPFVKSEPSQQAIKLREDLERLELQWQRLTSTRSGTEAVSSLDAAKHGSGLTGDPFPAHASTTTSMTRDDVMKRVNAALHPDDSVAAPLSRGSSTVKSRKNNADA